MGNSPSAPREHHKPNGGAAVPHHSKSRSQSHPDHTPSSALQDSAAARALAAAHAKASGASPSAPPAVVPHPKTIDAAASSSPAAVQAPAAKQPAAPSQTPISPLPQPSGPIDAPAAPSTSTKKSDDVTPSSLSDDSYLAAPNFYGPPRLPLRITEEGYTPGSPVLSPEELAEPIDPLSTDYLPKSQSILSDKTLDDEDIGDDPNTVVKGILPTVPFVIEWLETGTKVYTTGTFADWDRKYRLHKNGGSKNKDVLSVTINLQPGTYHLRFIVDGEMLLSKYLPTAVDFTNSLVNYIEVVAPETPSAGPQVLIPSELQDAIPQPIAPIKDAGPPQGYHPPLTLPPTPHIGPVRGSPPPGTTTDNTIRKLPRPPPEFKKRYTSVIPQFLQDIDGPEQSTEYRRASALTDRLPSPPSLPMFLNKSVLNGVTPMKDDASVLILPNHTVLNHLATSSIKNGVIATSATTRYKDKFETSIIFKPADIED